MTCTKRPTNKTPRFNHLHFYAATLLILLCVSANTQEMSAASKAHAVAKATGAPMEIRYPVIPNIGSEYEHQYRHIIETLKLVFAHVDVPHVLIPVTMRPSPADRIVEYMRKGIIDLAPRHTSHDFEAQLYPIRYPIYRGLIGWRIFFVRKTDMPRFASLNTLTALKTLIAGQGYNWPDTPILRSHGFNLKTRMDYLSILALLERNQIDYFPRSISEIWQEQAAYDSDKVAIEQTLALYYPAAIYFFVRQDDPALAQVFKDGFEKAVKNGSYKKLFYQFYGEILKRARVNERKVFKLTNPNLFPKALLQRKELWFSPDEPAAINDN